MADVAAAPNETQLGFATNALRRWLKVGSTPERLRATAIFTVLVLVAVGATSWLLTDKLVSQTAEVANSTGEVLIATQQVSASYAEADASAVSVHLAGADGNREQRRLYELATERATSSLEQVARLVGDDEVSHDNLQDIAARSTTYAGLIEAARLASVEDLSQADSLLSDASAVNRNEISPSVQAIASRARDRFNSQVSTGWYVVALILLVVAFAAAVAAHFSLYRRFRRVLNVPLALACLLLLAMLVVATNGFFNQQQSFSNAEENAFDAILVSQEIQERAYLHRALGTAAVLSGNPSSALTDLELELWQDGQGLVNDARSVGDSARERAAADEVAVRWNRYVVESRRVQAALAAGDTARAERITQGAANSTFNGFNTSVEAALLDNREQFLGELQQAEDSLRYLRGMILIGSLLAALLTWWGFAQRIGEYR